MRALPAVSSLVVLNDPETGFPLAIMDCAWVTAKRRGAASAVAAKCLARPDAEVLAIVGCGVQGQSHLEAMLVQCAGIRSVRAYDRLPAALERFARDAVAAHGVPVLPMVDAAAAVRERDIIVTATEISKQPRRVIPPERFRAGAFCVPVDFDAMFTPDAVRSMDLFYTDDVAQMDCSRSNGCFRATPPV